MKEIRNKNKKLKRTDLRENDQFIGAYKLTSELPSNEEIEENLLGFCCAINCTCSEEKIEEVQQDGRGLYITACGENSLWHRRCCHKVYEYNETWLPPLERAMSKAEYELMNPNPKHAFSPTTFISTEQDVYRKYNTAKRNESQFYNEDTLAGTFLKIEKNTAIVLFSFNTKNFKKKHNLFILCSLFLPCNPSFCCCVLCTKHKKPNKIIKYVSQNIDERCLHYSSNQFTIQ